MAERARAGTRTHTFGRTPLRLALGLMLGVLALAFAPVRAHAQANADSVRLRWTAPGDDGDIGTAASYELRWSTAAITDANFAQATLVTSVPAPLPASSPQRVTVRGLTRGVPVWFAVRAIDAAGNVGPLSNVLRWDWPLDAAPPAAPAGLNATVQSAGKSVSLLWQPNSEPDVRGYHVYRATSSGGPFTRINGALLPKPEFIDTAPSQTPGAVLWYAVTAMDASSNESPRSSALRVALGTAQPTSVTAARLEPPAPNPSRLGEPARFTFQVPAGAGGARLEILDENGVLVRRLAVVTGAIANVVWDGRNDAGRVCAPGVYRARLIADGVTLLVRVARVP